MKIKPWLQAFRLRTLPLAIGSITMGAFAASVENGLRPGIYALALLTATLLQILSNLANDYGDFKKGTDNERRIGPMRALQSGSITEKAMRSAVVLFAVLSLLAGIWLIAQSLQNFADYRTLIMLGIGLAAIAAAIKYTVGKGAYGYSGLGDIFVFAFFGLTAVFGTYFLMTKELNVFVLLPASCFGLLAAGVLNINNIRDIENDLASNKITLAVRLGKRNAQYYHAAIIFLALVCLCLFLNTIAQVFWLAVLAIVLFIPIVISTVRVLKNGPGEEPKLNRELKALSIGSALLAVGLFVLSLIL